MEPKLKSKQLVNSFYQPLGKLNCNVSSNEMWNAAKKFAIITVDEIINNKSNILDYVSNGVNSQLMCSIEYWESVKNEIQKL